MNVFLIAGISLVLNFLSLLFSFLFNYDAKPEFFNLISGSFLLSLSFVQILPAATHLIETSYPFQSLTIIITFTFLTLFIFIRDALALMDDNVLLPCDAINIQSTFTGNGDSSISSLSREKTKFVFKEHFSEIFYYIVFVLQSIPTGFVIRDMSIRKIIAVLIFRVLEYIILGKIMRKMKLSNTFFWILGAIVSIIEPIVVVIPVTIPSLILKWINGISSSILYGTYIFFATMDINSGVNVTSYDNLVIATIIIGGFAIPAGIRAIY